MLGREWLTNGREVGVMGRDEGVEGGFSSSCLGEALLPQGAL